MKFETQDSLVRRHLLGLLPEEEAVALEAKLFADDEQFERACEIENKLVDDYARGTLSPEERESFERYYLASPVHRRRAAFAQSLIERADAVPAKPAPTSQARVSWRARLSEKLSLAPALWQFAALAAALVLVAGGLWLFLDRARARRELAQLRIESEATRERQRTLADQVAAAQGQNQKLAEELAQLRAAENAVVPQTTPAPRQNIFSFLLSPTLVRSGGETQTLTIPSRADAVRLQMRVAHQGARRFRVGVRTVEGRQVWEQLAGGSRGGAQTALVTTNIPAGRLASGDYILTLSSVTRAGETEEINRYFFRVVKR